MEVWVILLQYDYDGATIAGVTANLEKAKELAEKEWEPVKYKKPIWTYEYGRWILEVSELFRIIVQAFDMEE